MPHLPQPGKPPIPLRAWTACSERNPTAPGMYLAVLVSNTGRMTVDTAYFDEEGWSWDCAYLGNVQGVLKWTTLPEPT